MLVKVIGTQRSTGVFTSKEGVKYPYDNVLLHTIRNENKVSGVCVEVLKVKLPLVEKAMGTTLAEGASLDALVDVEINVAFDRYAKVDMLELV